MKLWFCMDCRNEVELDKHGRCGHCDSEAVDLIETNNALTHSVSALKVEASSAQACA
jgi:Zn finger protein HypA/HybF involved in hydrogenase expression